MKRWVVVLGLLLVVVALVGCGGGDPAAVAEQEETATVVEGNAAAGTYDSEVLVVSYEQALPVMNQLALGIFRLQGTEDTITPEQASKLLPLWQAIQSGSLQGRAETDAVVKQIEGAMTAEQVAAIAAMQLTFEDLGVWAEEQGLDLGPPPEDLATRQAGGGGQGAFGNLSEEERAAMRATRQAGGGGSGPGSFGNLSEEERSARRATAEAGGGFPGGGRSGAGRGGFDVLTEPLIELLTKIAGE